MTLRSLGMSNEEIAEIGPDQNPFKDQGLGKNKDPLALLELQKKFYKELKEAYKEEQDALLIQQQEDFKNEETPLMSTPINKQAWSDKKIQEYERKRMLALQTFFNQERQAIAGGEKEKEDSFL